MSTSGRSFWVLGALAALLLGTSGCSDLITFSERDYDKGVSAYDEGRYTDAAGAFRASLRQDPRNYQAHYYLGLSCLQLGNHHQAVVAFRSCLETRNVTLAGRDDTAIAIKAMDGLAQAIVKWDDGDQEVNKTEQAARNAKGAAAAQEYFILAKVYRYRQLPDMAIDYYNRACLSDNQNFAYLKEYGLYLEQLHQKNQAEQTLRQAYALAPSDPEVSAALSRLGVVPGPSLMKKDDLAQPLLPKGPIPEVNMDKVKSALGMGESKPKPVTPPPAPTDTKTASTPRD